ncbi:MULTISPECIES: TonB-dependent receptor [Asticcacaulis]|uniref:TonB-dependent receptor n=1 Tax=Asticcacaulis TaxID=76890 RepID=UPI001AE2B2D7|nr:MULTISPECIES: TonB-dependent receptor [Asticcacaulis]MBP2161469.1 TonB-dependent receptor [Asticcacaulis solisilvae]MDR6802514.1 TonB-dependent receptor [Asticcacaulis sp. BE141]
MSLVRGTSRHTLKLALLSATILTSVVAGSAIAQDAAPAPAGNDTEVVVVTGYRGSLQNSTLAKQRATGFEDSIFAEDMGKFPDTNLAESFNRIPGITIAREITGEGTTIAIRGLGSSFTRVLLNGAPVAVGSTGDVNTSNTNREVDLDIFPPELFTQLTVTKSSSASLLEGGAAGAVNMRQARPFDFKGDNLQFSVEGSKNDLADDMGYKGSLVWSKKFGKFGVLAGVAYQHSAISVEGFESVGWTNAGLTYQQCGVTPPAGTAATTQAPVCNTTGGGNWSIPNTVPANAGNGLTTGATITPTMLLANNPGLDLTDISNGLIPRLGRPMHYYGSRDRISGILSLEYRPSSDLRFWLDSMIAQKDNDQERTDINFVGRSGSAIPLNMKVDRDDCSNGCIVTEATFANAQFFLEYRPFIEKNKFVSFNPGFSWNIRDDLTWTFDANYTHSDFRRDSPTVLVITPASSGVTATYKNTDGKPVFESNVDLNDPKNFGWNGGRLNMQSEERQTQTRGFHTDLKWGTSEFNIEVGFAYDDTQRKITPLDNTGPWQNYTCGNNPSIFVPGPNGQPACRGEVITNTAAAIAAGYPAYAGYGTGSTAGATGGVTWGGSAIPQSALANYLTPGPFGYVNIDWDKFAADSKYYEFLASAPPTGGSNINSPRSYLREKVQGAYIQVNGDRDIWGHRLRYDFGIRAVTTLQTIGGQNSIPDPRNAADPDGAGPLPAGCPGAGNARDGSCYPNIVVFSYTDTTYKNYLPSLNAALNITDSLIGRFAASTTMTRPNPSSLLPGLGFGDVSAFNGTLGNDSLTPYISDNLDFGLEWYTGKEGYVALTAFQKKMTGFTQNRVTVYPFSFLAQYGVTYDTLTASQKAAIDLRGGPNVANVNISQPFNAEGELKIDGLEFAWVQPLDQWFPALEGFGYSTNYTKINQSGTGAAPAIALGVPETTWNLTAFYERNGWSIRVSDTYRDGSQASLGGQQGIPNAALWNESYEQIDLSASVNLKEVFGFAYDMEATLNATNLNNAEMVQNFQYDNAPNYWYTPGTTVMLGLRGKF